MIDSASVPNKPDRPLTGITLMLAAVAAYTVTDSISKYLTGEIHPFQIVWSRYFVYVFILVPFVLRRGVAATFDTPHRSIHIWRSALMLASTAVFVFSLSTLDLVFAVTVAFASPFFVTMLSIPVLGEKVGMRRWSAIFVGFLGVLVALQPGVAFTPWSLLPLASAFIWAVGLILTRLTGSEPPLTMLVYLTAVGLVLSTPMMLPFWTWPSAWDWGLMIFAAICNLIGFYTMFRAFALAPASTLAPFSYSQILWATLLGWALMGQIPGFWIYVGGGIVVASGVYIWHRERMLAR
ncbi:MAG: DMT family transporter [Alphaproteobacteria bacterium]|nr:DMT family transporter [Alphaproteobacteria bacterium]